ncbi:hypothetical protein DXG01_014851 [Tephrocybe rancida]|nr:hypothetical protein DXG01_014851 [Tephrocybe rancida]
MHFSRVGAVFNVLTCLLEVTSAILMIVRSIQALKIFRLSNSRTSRNGFAFLVFEQGLLYFSITSLLTLAALIIGAKNNGFLQRLLGAITLPLSGQLTARFLLHLRQWDDKRNMRSSTRSAPTRSTIIEFTTIVSSFQIFASEFGDDPVAQAEWDRDRNREGLQGGDYG